MDAVSSSALASAATTYESTAHRGADNSPLGNTTTYNDQTIIHNSFEIENGEPKTPLSTREHVQLIPHANRVSRGYVKGGIPLMPPPNQWPRANGPRASLHERAFVDAHNYFGAYEAMRAQGEITWACYPCPCRVAIPDQYEADFRRRIHPHNDVMKQP